jgi:hypothetical protein
MTDEVIDIPGTEVVPPTIYRLEQIYEAGTLKGKGYSIVDIAEIMNVGATAVRGLLKEFNQMIEYQMNSDPYYLEKMHQHTLTTLMQMDEISKETWETISVATDNGMINARLNGLKLALDISKNRAALLQLTGQSKGDSDYIAKMQKVETVNQMLSDVLRDVISECPRCREQARVQLAEAFNLMASDGVDDAEVVTSE